MQFTGPAPGYLYSFQFAYFLFISKRKMNIDTYDDLWRLILLQYNAFPQK